MAQAPVVLCWQMVSILCNQTNFNCNTPEEVLEQTMFMRASRLATNVLKITSVTITKTAMAIAIKVPCAEQRFHGKRKALFLPNMKYQPTCFMAICFMRPRED